MKKQIEFTIQKQVCQYLRVQYPDVLFMSDTIGNVHLTIPQAVRNKAIQKEDFKCPDIVVFEPKGKFSGLFIELKKETPYKKNGLLKKNSHLEGQEKTIIDLNNKGYYATFAWSFDMAKEIIDRYMKQSI